jgi:hypothetical protein
MVKHIIFGIGGQSNNTLSWLSLRRSQFPSRLLLRFAAPGFFASRLSVDLYLERTLESSQWHVARVEKSGNSFTRVLSACLDFIKSLSNFHELSAFQQIDFTERDLIPPTGLQMRFDPLYLIRTSRPILIDPRQSTQGGKKGQTLSSGSIDKSPYTQKQHG